MQKNIKTRKIEAIRRIVISRLNFYILLFVCSTASLPLLAGTAEAVGVPRWIKMPLLTPEQRAAGIFPGGEGSQWPRGPVATTPADPDFLLLPIDVGGVYRSLDGGAHWEIAMTGWNARGANGFAIDPRNASRAIGIGANSVDWKPNDGPSPHGLYLTRDKAASWKQVKMLNGAFGGEVVYDATSYSPAKGFCQVAFYRSDADGLFRSEDGGDTWVQLRDAPKPGVHPGGPAALGLEVSPRLSIDPKTGALYFGGHEGLFRSADRGTTWSKVRDRAVYSLAVKPDGTVLINDPVKIYASRDGGTNWFALAGAGLQAKGLRIQGLVVSSVDPNRMFCWLGGRSYDWPRYVTQDGGNSWTPVQTERDTAPLPLNCRQGYFAWSAKDPQVAWCIGGDWVVKSLDGGKTFRWSNNGNNGVMVGGAFAFNAFDPDLVFVAFQDYNGAFTTDGGKTWNYRDVSGKGWGGYDYGGYALNRQVMWCGDSEFWGKPRQLRITRDGGNTWSYVTGADGKPLQYKAASDNSLGDPGDPKVGFAGNYRTADGGATWKSMPECDAVITSGLVSHKLFGRKGQAIVCSTDHGVTWTKVTELTGGLDDIAVDETAGIIYAASQNRLKVYRDNNWSTLETPADQYGRQRVATVAIDPVDEAVLYVGGPANLYSSKATICRSTDRGRTWRNLTVNTPIGTGVAAGPHEVSMIRVHPLTREAWVAGQCFGMWRIAPPAPGEAGVPAAQAGATRADAGHLP